LDHDGVPWNNTEHAVKQFAYYRRICESHVSVAGLQEYLVLLSIAQTCKYKGVSFLKFLLSRQTDVDAFCLRPRKRPPAGPPDCYPPGFSQRLWGDRKVYEVANESDAAGELVEWEGEKCKVLQRRVTGAAVLPTSAREVLLEGVD